MASNNPKRKSINRKSRNNPKRNSINVKLGGNFRWFKLLICFVAVFAIIQICQQLYSYNSLLKEVDGYRDQLAYAQTEYDELLEQKKLLSNDSYIETIAREKLGMVKQGEVLVSIAKNGDVLTLNENVDDNEVVH